PLSALLSRLLFPAFGSFPRLHRRGAVAVYNKKNSRGVLLVLLWGNNPMVGATVAVAVEISMALNK
ncbi:MAG: hypothetical protein IJC26_01970, partial [Clostridia bacterium]|nr:hypothetical protein [Clostridia bacterium]